MELRGYRRRPLWRRVLIRAGAFLFGLSTLGSTSEVIIVPRRGTYVPMKGDKTGWLG